MTASSFWGEIAEEIGVDLKIINIESDEGARLKSQIRASGVPCLVVSPNILVYGIQTNYEKSVELMQSLVDK